MVHNTSIKGVRMT